MSDKNSGSSNGNWFWLLFLLFWPVFGWMGDTPRNVHEDEAALAKAAPWVSTLFHIGGAIWATFYLPIWGLTWCLFAGLVLARRICASGDSPLRLYLRDLKSVFTSVPEKMGVYTLLVGSSAAITSYFFTLPWLFGDIQWGVAYFGPMLIIAVMGFGAVAHKEAVLEYRRNRDAWIPNFATIFKVSANDIADRGGISLSNGKVTLNPVPPTVAVNMTPENWSTIDRRIAGIAPHLMLDPDSDFQVVVLVPVDDETRARRAAHVASDGLLGTEVGVPSAGFGSTPFAEEQTLASSDFGTGLDFSDEDFS